MLLHSENAELAAEKKRGSLPCVKVSGAQREYARTIAKLFIQPSSRAVCRQRRND